MLQHVTTCYNNSICLLPKPHLYLVLLQPFILGSHAIFAELNPKRRVKNENPNICQRCWVNCGISPWFARDCPIDLNESRRCPQVLRGAPQCAESHPGFSGHADLGGGCALEMVR